MHKIGVWIIKRRDEELSFGASHDLKTVEENGFVPGTRAGDFFNAPMFGVVYGRSPTLGEMGCAVAHLQAYRFLVTSSLDAILVLESDAKQLQDFPKKKELYKLISKCETNWIISLEQDRRAELDERGFGADASELTPVKLRAPYGTTSYLISREAAEIVCAKADSHGVYWQADWPPHLRQELMFYRSSKPFFFHDRKSYGTLLRPAVKPPNIFRYLARVWRLVSADIDWKIKIGSLRTVYLRELLHYFGSVKTNVSGRQ